jgi:transposase
MEIIHSNAAGIDIGSRKVYVAVEGEEVRSFETFTSDFLKISEYLKSKKKDSVAMEATGVYWVTLFDILVKDEFDVWLVDGRQTKQVPGRKTDVKDCQWIQQLHSFGLLKRCFVAESDLKELRSYQRAREDHIRSCAMHINHMQKALIEMNIRLPEVICQVNGTSGLAIIKAILSGERDKHVLLSLCHRTIIKNKSEQVLKSLEGFYTSSGLFLLKQAYEAYFFYQNQIAACDAEISKIFININPIEKIDKTLKRKEIRHNSPKVSNLGSHLITIFGGRDATILPGFTDYSWLQLYSETGSDLTQWPTEKHFTSWLGLSPGQKNSGKRKKSTRKGRPKAGQIFRELAQSLLNSKKIALGSFARRIRSRKGPGIAVKATARKLAVLYWRLMVKGNDYVEKGVADYEEKLKIQRQKYLKKLAVELNFELVENTLNEKIQNTIN